MSLLLLLNNKKKNIFLSHNKTTMFFCLYVSMYVKDIPRNLNSRGIYLQHLLTMWG